MHRESLKGQRVKDQTFLLYFKKNHVLLTLRARGQRPGRDREVGRKKEVGRDRERETLRDRDSFVSPGVQNSRWWKRRRVWLEVPSDLATASVNDQPNSLPRHGHIQGVRKSGLQDKVHPVVDRKRCRHVAVLGAEGKGGGGGPTEEPEPQKLKIQWNVAAPLPLSFRILHILGHLECPAVKRDGPGGAWVA